MSKSSNRNNKEESYMKRILSILAVLAVAVNMVGCTPSDTAAPVEAAEQVTEETAEVFEMKTIEPPEDGWTAEQLNEVMYLNGKPFKLPCTLEELGEGFTISNTHVYTGYPFEGDGETFDYNSATLSYNECEIGYVYFLGNDINNAVIFKVEFFGPELKNIPVDFSINGVNLFSERMDIEKKLGSKFEVSEVNGNYSYIINDTTAILVAFGLNPENINEDTNSILAIGYYCK